MRILFAGGGTGGHLYPGLAIAKAVRARDASVETFFIGARRGIERTVLPDAGVPFELLELHPLYRQRPWENWRTVAGFARSWQRIHAICRAQRPAVVVGTGGYAAGAVLAYAARHRLPYAIQEQNSFAGLTVRVASRWAREIYLGFPEAAHTLRGGARTQVIDTGNPIEPPPAVRPHAREARARWQLPAHGTVLLAFGGSQGARALNEVIAGWVRRGLPDGVHLIWGTGTASYEQYAPLESDRVRVRAYLSPIADAYAAADVALTRAGAMSTAELCAWGLPTVLVPLPTAAADHQTANARALADAGAAIHLPQSELTVDALDARIRSLVASPDVLARMTDAARARARPDAAARIAERILALATGRAALS